MNKLLLSLAALLFLTFPSVSEEYETVVLREWDNNKNIEYLEYGKFFAMDDLRIYTLRKVYSEQQKLGDEGGYNISVSKYILNCVDKVFRLKKTYFFNGDNLVKFEKYDDRFYGNDPSFGWKKINSDNIQTKVSGILCK